MRILAIDPGVSKLGWVLARGRDLEDCGYLDLPGGNYWVRLAALHSWVMGAVRLWSPDIVACERPFVGPNPDTAIKLGTTLGVIFSAAVGGEASWMVVWPSQVRATGYHKEARDEAAAVAGWPFEDITADVADAIGVWQYVLARLAEMAASREA